MTTVASTLMRHKIATIAATQRKVASQRKQALNMTDVKNWASNNKDLLTGAGTGAVTYLLSGLIPGLRKERIGRGALALLAGLGGWMHGNDIRGFGQNMWEKYTPWGQQQAKRRYDAKIEAEHERNIAAENQYAIDNPPDYTTADSHEVLGPEYEAATAKRRAQERIDDVKRRYDAVVEASKKFGTW